MNTDKNILVTGGCGQVGVVVVKQLLEKGYKPVVLDINSSNSYINELRNRGIIEFYECNILKTDEILNLKGKFLEIQYVIHLASLVDGSADIIKSTF